MTKSDESLLEEVTQLLARERDALLSGKLDEIEALLPEKADLADRLEEANASELHGLEDLRATALRNQQLLDQALLGIKSVADRLAEMRKVKAQLDTYDSAGRKQSILTPRSSVERRA